MCTSSGDFVGVMNPGGKPIHISSPEDRNKVPTASEFFIDLGMPAAKVKKAVQIGDYVVMHEPFLDQPETVVSKALDNRFACWTAIEAVRKIDRARGAAGTHGVDIVVAFTVQEEVGLRGAHDGGDRWEPTTASASTSPSPATPRVPTQRVTSRVMARRMVQDSSMIADHGLVEEFCAEPASTGSPTSGASFPGRSGWRRPAARRGPVHALTAGPVHPR